MQIILPPEKTSGKLAEPSVAKLRALANLLDSAFHVPGTRLRFGVESLIGLIPVVGDLVGILISAYIIRAATDLGVPRAVRLRMGLNAWIDGMIGLIPFAGDLFDAGWKANTRNVDLLENALKDPAAANRSSLGLLFGLALGSVVAVASVVVLVAWSLGYFRGVL